MNARDETDATTVIVRCVDSGTTVRLCERWRLDADRAGEQMTALAAYVRAFLRAVPVIDG